MGRKPVTLLPALLLKLLPETVIESLYFDSEFRQRISLQVRQGLLWHPEEKTGIAGRAQMPPLDNQFKIRECLAAAHDADRLTGAGQKLIFPCPGIGFAVHIDEILLTQRPPARSCEMHQSCLQILHPVRYTRINRKKQKEKSCHESGNPSEE